MNKKKLNKHNIDFNINNEDLNHSESTNNKDLMNTESDKSSMDSGSDSINSMEDTNEYEEEEEEEEIDNHEIESLPLKEEKKRKKVTDEITEVAPKKKKKFENSLYKQPTVEELNQLRETENLFHSNLFRLQIEEVLNEVKFKDKYKILFDTWFEKLKKTIESIDETEEILVSNVTHTIHARVI